MSDLEQVIGACESLTQTFEQQVSNINGAILVFVDGLKESPTTMC